MCAVCEQFEITIDIKGPDQLWRIIDKLTEAVASGELAYNSVESDRAMMGQRPFASLKPDAPLPDVLRYYFDCPACGGGFGLEVETFHGQGGTWSKLR